MSQTNLNREGDLRYDVIEPNVFRLRPTKIRRRRILTDLGARVVGGLIGLLAATAFVYCLIYLLK